MFARYIPTPTVSQFSVGPITIHAYALCLISGAIAAIWITNRRYLAAGGSEHVIGDLAVWVIPAGVIGARLYHVISSPEYFFGKNGNVTNIFKIWEGGLGIWGAIGDCIALFISAMNFFPEQQMIVWLTFATTSSLTSLIAIRLTMKQLKINLDLSNLQYWQIPALSVISNLAHAFVTQLTLSHFIQKHYEFYIRDSLAMALGDFLGTMLIIGAVTVGIKLFNARKIPNQAFLARLSCQTLILAFKAIKA